MTREQILAAYYAGYISKTSCYHLLCNLEAIPASPKSRPRNHFLDALKDRRFDLNPTATNPFNS